MARSYKITKGPSKFDLMISLFHGESVSRQAVEFWYEDENGREWSLDIFIWSMEREGMRDAEQWVINGTDRVGTKFPITFNTQTRKGIYWPEPEAR